MKTYLFSFALEFGTLEVVTAWIDSRIESVNWITPGIACTAILFSEKSVDVLSELVRRGFPDKKFLIAEISVNSMDGWVPLFVWNGMLNASPENQLLLPHS